MCERLESIDTGALTVLVRNKLFRDGALQPTAVGGTPQLSVYPLVAGGSVVAANATVAIAQVGAVVGLYTFSITPGTGGLTAGDYVVRFTQGSIGGGTIPLTGDEPFYFSVGEVAGKAINNALRYIGASGCGEVDNPQSTTELSKDFAGNLAITWNPTVNGGRTPTYS